MKLKNELKQRIRSGSSPQILMWGGRIRVSFILLISVIIGGCSAIPKTSAPIPSDNRNNTMPHVMASIAGVVWDDLCTDSTNEHGLLIGCVFDQAHNLYYANGILEIGEPGIPNAEISIGKGSCPSKGLIDVLTQGDGSFAFSGLAPGEYCLSAVVDRATTSHSLDDGLWTFPVENKGKALGWRSIVLGPGEELQNVNFGWGYAKPAPSISKDHRSQNEDLICTNKATFLEDVTIPDGALLLPGESFEKIWRLKNTGSCKWTQDYELVFVEGDPLGEQRSIALAEEVLPGNIVELALDLYAPDSAGSYMSFWMLQDTNGKTFGLAKEADEPFWVSISVSRVNSSTYVESWSYSLDPQEMAHQGRWIDVDLGSQLLTAFEGSTPVSKFYVSSGTSAHPTVTGQFRIWIKLESTDMSGPGYALKDVPYTMYFYQGYGIHGTYWHDNFGTPMSHGCVNMKTDEAAWLFDFARQGTLVNVHP